MAEEPTRKLVKRLKAAGFTAERTEGSHTFWGGPNGAAVSVPDGHKTISPGGGPEGEQGHRGQQAVSDRRGWQQPRPNPKPGNPDPTPIEGRNHEGLQSRGDTRRQVVDGVDSRTRRIDPGPPPRRDRADGARVHRG
ncbi:type II toxin-antitoxin system HicA family toxin [Rhodococcus sp. NPDC056960]|uniref:type II toxin-antitoxin system HicA family toxin n=1 Tax=Rhodococcus sp. NPDC056960 TaxID=3345982 RepID=UPI00363ED289